MTTQTIITASTSSEPWADMPIDPAWIQEGTPAARGIVVSQSADKKVSSGFWSCTPGTFRWEFEWDEFIHVMDGEVTITDDSGRGYTLATGDTAYFPMGLNTVWRVTRTIRKFFVIRTPEPWAQQTPQ